MQYFEDFVVGEVIEFEGTYLVTEEEIREVGERWDPQPFHIDPVAAEAAVFGGLVASSVHLFAIAVSLGVNANPSAAVSSLGFDPWATMPRCDPATCCPIGRPRWRGGFHGAVPASASSTVAWSS